jgi:ATP-dependent RNA helicase DeaD
MEHFRKLEINDNILKSIEEHGFTIPSEIQEKTIPLVLNGKDVIAGASTGSGKTLAFGSAIIQNSRKNGGIQALVMTPTRELAEQVSKALAKFSKYNPLKIISVYGGVSINPQIEDLERADVVVGTPGRILDHLSRNTIDLSKVKILVLDEADRMLDMGFKDDVEQIINCVPKDRQTLLFSATISSDITHLARRYMRDPVEISAESYVDPSKLSQVYYDVDDKLKYSLLVQLIKQENPKLAMIFCNTRKNVDFVSNNLKLSGINALPIHGGFSQDKRNRVLASFHDSKINILVCTDVAARGLDIKGVSHVFNYDIPADSKEYIHRIGRTARAGTDGKVINILASRDYENFRCVVKNDELNIKLLETPFVERCMIKWIPEGRRGAYGGRNRDGDSHERRGGYSDRRGSGDRRESSDRRSSPRSGGRSTGSRTGGYGRSENRDFSEGRESHSRIGSTRSFQSNDSGDERREHTRERTHSRDGDRERNHDRRTRVNPREHRHNSHKERRGVY